VAALDLFKEHSFEEKLKIFFELADEDDRGYIDEEKLVKFFKRNLRNEDERRKVRPAVRSLFENELQTILKEKGILTRSDLDTICQEIPAF